MKKLLLLLTAFTLLLTACEDNTNNNTNNDTDLPVKNITLPSESSSLNPADTITVKGEGFLQNDQILLRPSTKAENTTIQAKVTQITATTLAFTVPTSTSGTFEILLLRDAKQYILGKLTFEKPKAQEHNLYAHKKIFENGKQYAKIVKINKDNGTETTVAELTESQYEIYAAAYIPSTKEFAGFGDEGLFKINITTGKLATVKTIIPSEIIIDENENIYAHKKIFENGKKYAKIVKINKDNGTETTVAELTESQYEIYAAAYIPSTKEFIGFGDEGLFKINLTTGKLTTVKTIIPSEIIIDENENIYAHKRIFENGKKYAKIVKINKDNGTETTVAELTESQYEIYAAAYIPSTKEFVGLGDEGLFKTNLTTGKTTTVNLQSGFTYGNLVID